MDQRLEVGSYVYYVALGICKIEGYEKMGDEDFIVLLSVNPKNPLKIFVPLNNADQMANINEPLNKKQIEKVMSSNYKDIAWNTNKRERQEQFLSIIKSTNFVNIISLILCLRKRNNELRQDKKRLSTFDGDILKKATRLCEESIAYAYNVPIEEANQYFMNKLA